MTLALVVAACSGDDGGGAATTSPSTTEAAATSVVVTSVAATTTVPATTTTVAVTTEPPTTVPTTTVDPNAPRPIINSVLEPGVWTGRWFSQPITFELTEPWEGFENTVLLNLVLVPPSDTELPSGSVYGEIAFDLSTSFTADEAVAELRALEGIDFGEPVPSELAGLTGVALTAPPTAEDVDIGFAVYPDQSGWYLPAGGRNEVHVLGAPDGRTMIVWIDGYDGTWDDFRPRAQAVLDSVRWE